MTQAEQDAAFIEKVKSLAIVTKQAKGPCPNCGKALEAHKLVFAGVVRIPMTARRTERQEAFAA